MDGCCTGVGQNHWGITAPCRLMYLVERGTQLGAIGVVVGLYCDVVCNAIVVIVRGVVLQNGKRVVALCMSLVDRLQELDVCRCHGVMQMQCGRHLSWGAGWWGGNRACTGTRHPW